MAAWIHYPGNVANLAYASTTNFTTFTSPQSFPATGYTYSGDPVLDENPYNANIGPLRMYCVGLTSDNRPAWSGPNAIYVWHSDASDNGQFTATPAKVDSRYVGQTSPEQQTLDKPSLAVSWHTGVGASDLGYVYVAYTSLDFGDISLGGTNPGNTAIEVATSTDGGVTFGTPVVVAYGGAPTTGTDVAHSQIVVSSATGNVYVMWVDWSNGGSIQMAMSSPGGTSFGSHVIAATGSFSNDVNNNLVLMDQFGRGLTAETVPVARYNHVTGTIDLVWHDHGASGMDVRYAYYNGTWHQVANTGTTGVQFTTGDQFMPAIDYNAAGNVVITYYSQTPGTLSYRSYAAYCTSAGVRIDQAADHDLSGFDSAAGYAGGSIGDYQTVFDWNFSSGESATAAWIGYRNAEWDPYVTRITY